jgi:hypothetical protein
MRVRRETRDRLREISDYHRESGVQTLDRLVGRAYDELLLAQMVEGLSDPTVDADTAEWGGVAGDGLDDD